MIYKKDVTLHPQKRGHQVDFRIKQTNKYK